MNKQSRKQFEAFCNHARRSPMAQRYILSQRTAQEQAIAEHAARGFADGLTRVAGLLDQRNKR